MTARRAIGLVAIVLLAACGSAEKAGPEPSTPPTQQQRPTPTATVEAEPASVDEALARIRAAKSDLEAGDAPSDRPTPVTPSPPGPKPGQSTSQPPQTNACATPCRAIESMRRAVTALCRMTGEDDARCKDARHTLASSEERVRGCACR